MMCLIFSFSGQDADTSSELSFQVGVKVFSVANDAFDKGWSMKRIEQLSEKSQYYIRKTAHFTEYFVLAVTVAFPLYVYGIRGIWLVILAGGYCIVFAGFDEYHQSFIDGRSPQKKDVLIDSCGVILGVIITRIIGWTGRMTVFRPLSNHKKPKESY
ncbi:VanZ family protein [Butyrivibrio sp. VCB2006]|uniref:VanZ family protein n=1 Tax=Butyrivibrio sp. VCB2006 TaxID=1280679 RepID=UPI00040F114E